MRVHSSTALTKFSQEWLSCLARFAIELDLSSSQLELVILSEAKDLLLESREQQFLREQWRLTLACW